MKKDQLCTLLITFADPIDPVKQITTAHSFASTDPRHYPQKRRVVHSQQEDEKVDSGAYMTVSRSAHSALGGLGSDMVERGPFQLLKGGGRQLVIQEVRLCYTRTTKESSAPPIDLPRAGPLQIDYTTYDHNRDVKQRAAVEEAASYVAKTQDGQVREDSIEAEREAKKNAYEGEPIKITITTGHGTPSPAPAIGAGAKKEVRSPPSKMPAYEKPDGTYEKYREEYSRDMQESRSAYERNFKETMAKKTTYVKQAPSPPQPKQQTSPKPIVVPISREVPINGYGNGYRNKEDIRLYARYDDRTHGQPSPETAIKRPRIIEEYPIKIPVTITTSSPPPPTSPPPRQLQPSREEIRPQGTPRARYSREEAYYLHEEYYRKTKKPVIKPQIIAFGSTYNFAQVQKDQSKEVEVIRQDRSQVIEESRRSQGVPRVIECELRPRPQVVEGPKPRGLPRTPLEEIERISPGLPRTEIARAEPIDYETYRREVEILQEQQRRAAKIEKREGSPQVSAEPRPIQIEALEPSSEAIRQAETRRQVIEESRPRKIEEYGFDYMETREEVKRSATPKRETRFGVVESPEPTIRASPARVIEEYAEQLTESVLSPEISRSRMTSPESRTSTPSTFPIKSPSIKSPEPVKSPPPRRIEEFSAEILQKYEEFAKQHPPRSKSHERPREVREAERRARDYPVGKIEETTLEFIKKRDEIKAKSGSTSFPSHSRTPYQPYVEGRRPVVTKTKEIIEREFREKVEIVESSRAYKKYGIPLSPASPTGRKVQETRKVFEHEEEIGSSRTSVATPSPRPTVEIPGRIEISEIQMQITETLKKVEQKVKPPPPAPVVVSTKVEEKTTKISEEELQERLKKLQPLPIKETSEKSTQAEEEKPKLTETATQLTPLLPESFHIGTQAETPLSISTGTQPEPVKTFEASTQKGHPISLDSTTQFELVESSEVAIQAEPQSPGFHLEDITDRQLRELLRREYQIEDIVDIDVVRRQRVKDERELDVIPETVEAEEEVEESREAEIRETPIQLPTILEPIKLEEDESTFEERVDETLTRTMATIEKTRKSTSSTTKKNDSKTNEKSSSFVSSATVTPKTTKTTSPVTATAELKLSHDIDTSHRMDYYTPEYRSTITPRTGHVRSDYRSVSPASTTRMLKVVSETSSISGGGLLSPYGSTAAATIRDAREREKKEMSDLNDRLASYIEKVRFLEAQNRKLAADLDFLRNRWGRDTHSIRDMYESELKQAKKVLHDANKDRDELEKQIKSLHDEIGTYRRKYEEGVRHRDTDKKTIDELLNKLATLESEVDLLRRRIANLEDDVSATKRENVRLMNDLQRARMDLDQETLNRIDYQNQVQTLLEEVEFLRRAHDQEIRDLQAMASRDTTSENREYFKNELAQAIREIREEYEQLCNVQRNDMESWYKLKVQEIQTQSARQTMEQSYAKDEIKRLRVQLGDLRGKLADLEGRNSLLEKQIEELNYQLEDDQRSYEAALNDRDSQIRKIRDECQALMVELQMLLDTKQTLDAEIAIYRKMLEGEEDRAGLRQLVEQVVRTHQFKETQETDTMRVLKGETASRSSYQRSAKGNVSILEAANDGKYVIIENTHRSKEEDIGEWKLKRRLDSKKDLVFTFPKDFILKPGKTVKIWSRGHGVYNPPDQLVFDAEDTWGTGHNVHTILYNTQGEERATLIQRTSHTTSGH